MIALVVVDRKYFSVRSSVAVVTVILHKLPQLDILYIYVSVEQVQRL